MCGTDVQDSIATICVFFFFVFVFCMHRDVGVCL